MLYVGLHIIICCFRAHSVSYRFDRLLSGVDTDGDGQVCRGTSTCSSVGRLQFYSYLILSIFWLLT